MAFARFITDTSGKLTVETIQLPEDVRQTEEAKAEALLEEKERARTAAQYAVLRPVPDVDQPVQRARKRAAQKEED